MRSATGNVGQASRRRCKSVSSSILLTVRSTGGIGMGLAARRDGIGACVISRGTSNPLRGNPRAGSSPAAANSLRRFGSNKVMKFAQASVRLAF